MLEKIREGLWDEALKILTDTMRIGELNEEEAILGATILEHFGEYESMYMIITNALKKYPESYELYLLLGNYFSSGNLEQAYLSYENALYHCQKQKGQDSEDYLQIKEVFDPCRENTNINVRNVSFVILSYNEVEYTRECIQSIRDTCYQGCYEIIVVDNGSDKETVDYLKEQKDIKLILNENNKGFPAACNQGIREALPPNDILLLNNDTLLLENSLYTLRLGLYEDSSFGAVGAVTNHAPRHQEIEIKFETKEDYINYALSNNVPGKCVYEYKTKLIMFAMLIRRDAVDRVGELDEIFTPGNYEDDDYGIRIWRAGYKNVLCHNCFIYHYGSVSFGKVPDTYNNLQKINAEKFKDKWGFSSAYFTHVRKDIISLIKRDKYESFNVLEIGCGMGETLARIKYEFPNCSVFGIEIVSEVVDVATEKFPISCGNVEKITINESEKYDYIICADVLEHLRNPEEVIIKLKRNLKKGGRILTSIPNLMNARVIYDLLHGNFTYQDAGILDKTHLRFFTENEIKGMFDRCSLKIFDCRRIISLNDGTQAFEKFYDKLLQIEGVAPKKNFDVYQYLIAAGFPD